MHPIQAKAKEVRRRLTSVGKWSSELEVVSEAEILRRARQAARIEREQHDVTRQAARREARIAAIVENAKKRQEEYRRAEEAFEVLMQQRKGFSIRKIIDTCCRHYRTPPLAILSARREAPICRVRHIIAYLCAELSTRSLPEIGRCLGGRDHTTILNSRTVMRKKIASDPAFASEIEDLRRSLEGR